MRNCLMKRFKRLFRECKVIGRSDEKFHKNVGRMMGPFRSGSGGGGGLFRAFFGNCRRASRSFYMGVPPGGSGLDAASWLGGKLKY